MSKLSNTELIQHTTIRLECLLNNGGNSVGTGFYFAFHKDETQWDKIVIITNKHVIRNSVNLTVFLTPLDSEKKPDYVKNFSITIDVKENDWIAHPEDSIDLCILPYDLLNEKIKTITNEDFYFFAYNKEYLADFDKLESLSAIETITMIGYPNGIWDKANNIPVIRQGITASHPKLNYNNKAEILIDCACFGGSSGSPVLIFNPGGHVTKEGHFNMKGRLILLGILYAGPQYKQNGEIIVTPISTLPNLITSTNLMLNLGFIIKSEKLLDFERFL